MRWKDIVMWQDVEGHRYGRMWEGVRGCGRIWLDMGDYGMIWWDVGGCDKMRENMGGCGRIWEDVGNIWANTNIIHQYEHVYIQTCYHININLPTLPSSQCAWSEYEIRILIHHYYQQPQVCMPDKTSIIIGTSGTLNKGFSSQASFYYMIMCWAVIMMVILWTFVYLYVSSKVTISPLGAP